MTTEPKSVKIGDLRENDYNPRRDLGDVESLANSIEQDGLIQALTVRPVGDGEYEVISGSRRLAALRQVYDEDHSVEVVVRDVDDDTARRLALKENIERKDLTTMEEAWAFAREVAVSVNGENKQFTECVSELGQHVVPDNGHVPSGKHPDVSVLADSIGKSGEYVSVRLSFLTLPQGTRSLIDTGDLTKRAARMLARIDIDDADARSTAIQSIIDDLPASMSDDDYGDLKNAIMGAEKSWQDRKRIAEDSVSDYADLVDARRDDLATAIEDAAKELGGAVVLSGDVDELVAEAEAAVETLAEKREEAGAQRVVISGTRDERERALSRTEQAIAAHDGDDECPYCGSAMTMDDLAERRERLVGEVRSAEDAIDDLTEREGNLRSLRTSVKTSINALEDALKEYRGAKKKAEQYAEVSAGDD